MAEKFLEISFTDSVRKAQQRCFGNSQLTTHKGRVNVNLLEFLES